MAYKITYTFYLSDMDKQLLQLIADGWTAKEIGEIMVKSARTIEGYTYHLRKYFHARNTADLVSICYREGILNAK